MQTSETDRVVRFNELRTITGLSRSSIWRLQRNNSFPNSIRISKGACGWLLSDILTWLEKTKKRSSELLLKSNSPEQFLNKC